jgi:hypothetical protein
MTKNNAIEINPVVQKSKSQIEAERKAISEATAPKEIQVDAPILPQGVQEEVIQQASDKPKEGDSFIDERGDLNIFKDGAWLIQVASNPHTGQ